MCYLVAKDVEKQGSFVLKTKIGKHLADFVNDLNKNVRKGIQIVTISRPIAFGEYAPYTFVEDEETFRQKVINM